MSIQSAAIDEAKRQVQICNACRYCEGFCSAFQALTRRRMFADGDITQLANLCHNCRGCYYSCQYTAPHEFDLNIPQVFAQVRAESWEQEAWPRGFARLFQRHGVAIGVTAVLGFAFLFVLAQILGRTGGEGFYAYLSHNAMVAVFAPAFILPLIAVGVSLRRYWRAIGGERLQLAHLLGAFRNAATLKDLSGGQGQGCNFEKQDRYSNTRRVLHQAVLYGFLLCFAATSVATLMHYGLGWEAPYGFFTPPKLLGVPGGLLLVVGTLGLAWLKTQADPALGERAVWGGEMAFVLLLFVVAASGLALYAATGTSWVFGLLALHLGSVLAFFLLIPYSKMVHGFYRLAALARDVQEKEAIR